MKRYTTKASTWVGECGGRGCGMWGVDGRFGAWVGVWHMGRGIWGEGVIVVVMVVVVVLVVVVVIVDDILRLFFLTMSQSKYCY